MKHRNLKIITVLILITVALLLHVKPGFKCLIPRLSSNDYKISKDQRSCASFYSLPNTDLKSQRTSKEEANIIVYDSNYTESFTRFNIEKAHIKFLENFKSPCFLEKPAVYQKSVYERNEMVNGKYYRKRECFSKYIMESSPTFIDNISTVGQKYRLRCLPYFMLIGVAKSGTTDFTQRVSKHPLVFRAAGKELYWWDQYRFLLNSTLSDYTDLFDKSTANLTLNAINGTSGLPPYYPGVTGEMTSITMTDLVYWREDPRNAGLNEPTYLTPYDIHSLLPNVKLIVLLRNPVTRLYSHYNMFSRRRRYATSPQDFHMRVMNSIQWWEDCNRILPLRNCLYGSPPEMPEVEHVLTSWWPDGRNYTGTLRDGLYYFMLKDWLNIFPRENFLFIRSEDYKLHKGDTINHKVFPFLGLPKLDNKSTNELYNLGLVFSKMYEPMLNSTFKVLTDFYAPYNENLATLLQNDKWKWNT